MRISFTTTYKWMDGFCDQTFLYWYSSLLTPNEYFKETPCPYGNDPKQKNKLQTLIVW